MNHDGFLQDVLANPDDEGLRLIYADWLEERGDPRGAFIRIQCQMADPSLKGPKRWKLRAEARRLLLRHEQEWLGPLRGLVERWEFRRGFVEFVEMRPEAFLEHAETLFRATPLRHLKTVLTAGAEYAPAGSPYLARLATLEFSNSYAGDPGVYALLESPSLGQLRSLLLRANAIGPGGAAALANSPKLSGLSRLDLGGNPLGNEGLIALCQPPHLTGLTTLNLWHIGISSAAVRALTSPIAPRLTRLDLGQNALGDRGVWDLVEAPHLSSLRELGLRSNDLTDVAARALAGAPHLGGLKQLDLVGNWINREGREALVGRFGKGVCTF